MHKYLRIAMNVFIIAALAVGFLYFMSRGIAEKGDWSTDAIGLLQYPGQRAGLGDIGRQLVEDNSTYTIEKVIYSSREKQVFGLLFLPKGREAVPALIMLPGARGGKENHLQLGRKMAAFGYAFLTIDQRGIGETDGFVPAVQEDFQSFMSNREPVQDLMVYDVLRAFDFLKRVKQVDSSRVVVAGESMGGRFALIAAALDKNIKGAVVFSTSGFGPMQPKSTEEKFMAGINPDMYVSRISPRKLVMFHARNDSVVKFEDAQRTFSFAQEPKKFVEMPAPCDHGWCDAVYDEFLNQAVWVMA